MTDKENIHKQTGRLRSEDELLREEVERLQRVADDRKKMWEDQRDRAQRVEAELEQVVKDDNAEMVRLNQHWTASLTSAIKYREALTKALADIEVLEVTGRYENKLDQIITDLRTVLTMLAPIKK